MTVTPKKSSFKGGKQKRCQSQEKIQKNVKSLVQLFEKVQGAMGSNIENDGKSDFLKMIPSLKSRFDQSQTPVQPKNPVVKKVEKTSKKVTTKKVRSTNNRKIEDYFEKLTTSKTTQSPHRKASHDHTNPDHVTSSARTEEEKHAPD